VQSSPAFADGALFLNAGDALYALDPADGSERWSAATGGSNSPPAVRDGTAYAPSDEQVYAFDAESGEELWATRVGRDVELAASGSAVYATGHGTPVVALDPADGRERWRQRGVEATTAPAVADDYLFVGAADGWAVALGPDPE
jgi:outer membrane protein assembly factor BamB